MNCNKSFKRNVLTQWGMKALDKGMSWDEVVKTISKMMKKTMKDVEIFVSKNEGV